jgi:hypothetical protein
MNGAISLTYQESKNRNIFNMIFFVLWPLGAFFYSLYHYERKESKIIIILFTAIFGYSMVAESKGLDLYRMLHSLPVYADFTAEGFLKYTGMMYSNPNSESIDFYRDIVTFIVSRFTNDGRWLMTVFGLIAGFVFTRTIDLFIFSQYKRNLYIAILLICFSFIIGIDHLAGVRFGLAAFVFFTGALKFIQTPNLKFFLLAALSSLIHFSFLPLAGLLLLFLLMKKSDKIVYLLLFISILLPRLFNRPILEYSGVLGQAIEKRTEMYYGLVSELNYGSNTIWYVRYRVILIMVFAISVLIIAFLKRKQLNANKYIKDIFLFDVIILAFVNFTRNIPHYGYRFQFVFLMFFFFYLFKLFNSNLQSLLLKRVVLLALPFSSLMIAYGLRSILFFTSPILYLGNLPMIFMESSSESAWTFFFK